MSLPHATNTCCLCHIAQLVKMTMPIWLRAIAAAFPRHFIQSIAPYLLVMPRDVNMPVSTWSAHGAPSLCMRAMQLGSSGKTECRMSDTVSPGTTAGPEEVKEVKEVR